MRSGKKIILNRETISMLFLAALPILDPYILCSSMPISLCDLAIILCIILSASKGNLQIHRPLMYLLLLDLLLTLLSALLTDPSKLNYMLALKVFLNFTLFLIAYSSMWTSSNRQIFYRIVVWIGVTAALLAILQFIFANLGWTGFYSGKLPFAIGQYNTFGGLIEGGTGRVRVHSFFEEPSYLALYELPITAWCIKEKKILPALITGSSCIISASLLGVTGVVMIMVYFLLMDQTISRRNKLILILFLIAALLAGSVLYLGNENISYLINYYIFRIRHMEFHRSDSSASQRLLGNIGLFSDYDWLHKIIGVGFNQYPLYFGLENDYSNDFVCTIMNFGIIGILFLILYLIHIGRKTEPKGKIFFFLFLFVLMVDHTWFGTYFFYLLTWCMFSMKEEYWRLSL